MRQKRLVGKDMIIIIILLAVVFGFASFVKDLEPTVTGLAVEEINQAPVWTGESTTFTLVRNDVLVLSLGDYFTDVNGDALTYLASEASNIRIEVSGQQLRIEPETDFVGERLISVFASDGQETTKQSIRIEVLETPAEQPEEPVLELNDAIKDQNGRSVGKKIEEDYTFDTIIDNVERGSHEFIVKFHHNANDALPIWIEGWADYTLSKQTALPGETITLTVPLIGGIVPKFKLHVGETSDIFEFGKTIPSILITDETLNSGDYTISDREDDYVDVELIQGNSRVILNAVDAEEVNAKIGENAELEVLKTEIIAIDPIEIGSATITLAKTGKVSVIRTCADFDTTSFTCPGEWEITDIPFTDMGDYIIFTVDHFSAYAGGAATQMVIWDDSDLGTQFVGNPLSFYANFTNATGSANNTNGSCRIRLNTTGAWGAWFNMTFNATGNDIYNYTATFGTQGTPFYYEINCTGTGENLAATDSFYVYQFLPNQGLLSCTFRTGIACLPGETKVLGMSATTNAHAELASQSNYNTSICCQDLSGRNIIYANGTIFLNLSNNTNAHVAFPNSSVPYNFSANISGSSDNLTCNFINNPTAPGFCTYPAGCVATISNDTNAHISDCTNNPYNWTICCGFALVPLNSTVNITKNATPNPVNIGSQLTYTLFYENLGPGTAYNITVNETYPNGTNFVSANPAPSVGNNVWTFSNLTPGQNGTITIILLVTNSVANGTYLNNTVNVTWQNDTGDNSSNTANASVLALSAPPTPTVRRSSGGWPAAEGARQMYANTAAALTTITATCNERWICGEWEDCISGQRTRTCVDQNACGTAYYMPGETTTCIIEKPAAGQAITPPEPVQAPPPVYKPEEPEIKKSKLLAALPFATHGLIILLTIILLVYLIREHFLGKKTHDAWYYALYALFALSILSIAAELLLTDQVPYPAIFAVGAIVMVFILDGLLRRIANRPLRPVKVEEIPPKTHVLKIPKAKTHKSRKTNARKHKETSEDELDEISRKLKELKV